MKLIRLIAAALDVNLAVDKASIKIGRGRFCVEVRDGHIERVYRRGVGELHDVPSQIRIGRLHVGLWTNEGSAPDEFYRQADMIHRHVN